MKTKEEIVQLKEYLHSYIDQLNTEELKRISPLLNIKKEIEDCGLENHKITNLLSQDMVESNLKNLLDLFLESNKSDNSQLFIDRLFPIITSFEKNAIEGLLTQSINAKGKEEALYYRTLADFLELQKNILSIKKMVINKVQFIETIKKMNHDISSAKKHLKFVSLLAHSLENIIDLMSYDESERQSVDIRDGFQFTSGSMSLSHKYYDFPEAVDK